MIPIVEWPDRNLPHRVLCAPGILTGLEMLAVDGLLAMPRIGLGVGGLLLGCRQGDSIAVLCTVPIDCSHARGPAFVLTAEERAACPDAGAYQIVGWYCSKPGGSVTLTDHERELFDSLCPEPWQATLFIWPRLGSASTGAFGFRGASGIEFGSPLELAWQELGTVVMLDWEPTPAAVAEPIPEIQPEPEPELTISEPERPPRRSQPPAPAFGMPEPRPRPKRRRGPLQILTGLAVSAAVLTALGAAAFFTRDYWMPQSRLALVATSDWTGRVTLLWNPEAIDPGRDHATLDVDDGARQIHTFHLNRADLRAGWVAIDCLPGKVDATLLAGEATDAVTFKVKPAPYFPASGISK